MEEGKTSALTLVILLYISWKLIFVNDYNFITFDYDSFSSYSPELSCYFITSIMKEEIGKPVTCSSSHSKTMTLSMTYLKLFPKPIPNWLVDNSSDINCSYICTDSRSSLIFILKWMFICVNTVLMCSFLIFFFCHLQ